MASPSTLIERLGGYFHSLSKVMTNQDQYPFESKYKSAHTVTAKEVLISDITYCATREEADAFVINNSSVTKYDQYELSEVPGSNGQSWYINDNKFIRPLISPVDIPDEITNLPSIGFQITLYKNDGTYISPTSGVWFVDYYAGIIHFEEGYTPLDMGYGIPKITAYAYSGNSLRDRLDNLENTSDITSNFKLKTTGRLLIQNNTITLPSKAYGDIVHNIAQVWPTQDSLFCLEYTCQVTPDGTKVYFAEVDNLNGQYAIVSYLESVG